MDQIVLVKICGAECPRCSDSYCEITEKHSKHICNSCGQSWPMQCIAKLISASTTNCRKEKEMSNQLREKKLSEGFTQLLGTCGLVLVVIAAVQWWLWKGNVNPLIICGILCLGVAFVLLARAYITMYFGGICSEEECSGKTYACCAECGNKLCKNHYEWFSAPTGWEIRCKKCSELNN